MKKRLSPNQKGFLLFLLLLLIPIAILIGSISQFLEKGVTIDFIRIEYLAAICVPIFGFFTGAYIKRLLSHLELSLDEMLKLIILKDKILFLIYIVTALSSVILFFQTTSNITQRTYLFVFASMVVVNFLPSLFSFLFKPKSR